MNSLTRNLRRISKRLSCSLIMGALLSAGATVTPSFGVGAHAKDFGAHCARVGDDDALTPLPRNLVAEARRLFELSADATDAYIRKSTFARCMGGKAWLCNVGANLVCGKANASRVSSAVSDYCRQNPGSGSVPMYVTGHDTIYAWECVGNEARVTDQMTTVDARGFIAENWKPLDR